MFQRISFHRKTSAQTPRPSSVSHGGEKAPLIIAIDTFALIVSASGLDTGILLSLDMSVTRDSNWL